MRIPTSYSSSNMYKVKRARCKNIECTSVEIELAMYTSSRPPSIAQVQRDQYRLDMLGQSAKRR